MGIVAAGIAPHPPIIIPEIGGRELAKVRKTVDALDRLARIMSAARADTYVIITPHGPLIREAPVILAAEELKGGFDRFGAPHVKLKARNDLEMVHAINKAASEENLEVFLLKERVASLFEEGGYLDHGVLVPLYYLQRIQTAQRLVAITFALLPYNKLFRFGEIIRKAAEDTGRNIAVVASGDLSHRLSRGAPAGYHPRGKEFDEKLVEDLKNYSVEKILSIDEKLVYDAGECGLRSIIILFGCLSAFNVKPEILSYEGPFGVGYLVASFKLLNREGS